MNSNMQRARELGMNNTHDQSGALTSQSPAIWFEIQPKLRLFRTNGTRSNSGRGFGTAAGMAFAVIIQPLSFSRAPRSSRALRLLRSGFHSVARTVRD